LTALPWEDRPLRSHDLVWRYSGNPIIDRNAIPTSNSIFNSAVVRFGEKFAGVFRCDNRRREMRLHAGFSSNGMDWEINNEEIAWKIPDGVEHPEYGYDPRVTFTDGRYLITWCNGFHGPCIAIGETTDFRHFDMIENVLLPYNRNGVLFPRQIGGDYCMLSRPSDIGHTPFGDIFISRSRDLIHWGRHRFVMSPIEPWESTKIGAGPVPIETDEGWLVFYHGVLTSCNGFVYHFGAALLDLEAPWKLIAKTREYLMSPQMAYEQVGDVPNVVFPCAALTDGDRVAIYYGCADTVTGLAFCHISEIISCMKRQ
jgi:beta-1,4-mannooligosaccharide/beta-1,4-mannosyl-N-acetylglucosamine phosphorylase